jgi:hypothetical protein
MTNETKDGRPPEFDADVERWLHADKDVHVALQRDRDAPSPWLAPETFDIADDGHASLSSGEKATPRCHAWCRR